MSQLQINKKLITDQEFKSDLSYKFDLHLESNWSNYANRYPQKVEIVEDNRLFITQIYVDDKLVYDLQQDQQKEIDQTIEFNKQELDKKEETEKLGYKISHWKLYPCKSCYSFKESRTSDWDSLTCKNCEMFESLVEDFKQLENQEMETRLDILNREYTENKRNVEPKKNKYCKKTKTKYIFKCGQTYPLEYNTLDAVTENHFNVNHCLACKILVGESKRKKGFTQGDLSKLFTSGDFPDHESSSGNLCISSSGKTLTHYSTIEAIKTIDNIVIDNSQCWSAGFAHCPYVEHDYSLPLTSIEDFGDIHQIKVLENKDSTTLFKIGNTCYLVGRDDGQQFLVELFDKVKTISEAFESMIPLEARNKEYKRQGDLFFIPVKQSKYFSDVNPNYQKAYYEKINVNLDRYTTYSEDRKLEELYQKLNIYNNNSYWNRRDFSDATTGLLRDQIKRDFINKTDRHKRLERPQIFDTNHESTELVEYKKDVYVNGIIYHRNHQHQKLKLDQWHLVKKNRVIQSFNVSRQSMGRD